MGEGEESLSPPISPILSQSLSLSYILYPILSLQTLVGFVESSNVHLLGASHERLPQVVCVFARTRI